MLPVLRLGPFTLPAGPLALLAAFYLALEIGERGARRRGLPKELMSNVAMLAFGAGILAARLGYVAKNLAAYQLDWSQVFALDLGTLHSQTGAITALIAAYAYLQRKNVNLRAFLDALAPALTLAFAVLSFGNLLTGDGYGAVARDLPWAIFLWGEPRHPVQAYEMVAYLAIFILLWFRAPRLEQGGQFLLAVALLAGARVLLEPFRGDSLAGVAGLRAAQVIALAAMTIAGLMLARQLNVTLPRTKSQED